MYNWARVACGYNLTEIPRKKSWLAQDLISRPLDLYPLGRCDFHFFHHFLTHPIGPLICVEVTVLRGTTLLRLLASPSCRSQMSSWVYWCATPSPRTIETTCYLPLWWRHWSVSFWSIDSASHSFLRLTVFSEKSFNRVRSNPATSRK